MDAVFSVKRKYCAENFERHKRVIYHNQYLRLLTDLDVDALKRNANPSKVATVLLTDIFCHKCFRRTAEQLSACTVSEQFPSYLASFVENHEVVEYINVDISTAGIETNPLGMPFIAYSKSRPTYAAK